MTEITPGSQPRRPSTLRTRSNGCAQSAPDWRQRARPARSVFANTRAGDALYAGKPGHSMMKAVPLRRSVPRDFAELHGDASLATKAVCLSVEAHSHDSPSRPTPGHRRRTSSADDDAAERPDDRDLASIGDVNG